jgi:hypothetical protein
VLLFRLCSQNYATWDEGEPAFVKYWVKSSLAQRSGSALEEEEGFSQVRASPLPRPCLIGLLPFAPTPPLTPHTSLCADW